MELIFATHNPNKIKEIRQLLPKHIRLISLNDINCTRSIPETADTLKGNAKLKADFITTTYNKPCFADDTGLLVNSLNGAPGVFSARYAGPKNDANANMDKLLQNLEGKKDRTACFQTVIALNIKGETIFFEGEVQGEIIKEKKGGKGFGYDPIFKPKGFNGTFAELPLETKNKIGHRGKAFSKLIDYLGRVTPQEKKES
ncbi:non-canonical purine NTP diphosphatase [Maribacter sp. 2304DJ31-5]|uniref:non-canonical purine NTP diphosphatase n=1 Tax=Maribacter sp. 2304DJ31-5 TaxID=3386273 RepID=UPI0039BD3AE9